MALPCSSIHWLPRPAANNGPGDLTKDSVVSTDIGKYQRQPRLVTAQAQKRKRTKTTSPTETLAMLRLPPTDSSLQPAPSHLAKHLHWSLRPHALAKRVVAQAGRSHRLPAVPIPADPIRQRGLLLPIRVLFQEQIASLAQQRVGVRILLRLWEEIDPAPAIAGDQAPRYVLHLLCGAQRVPTWGTPTRIVQRHGDVYT